MDRRTMLKLGAAFAVTGCGSPFSVPEGGDGDPRLSSRPRVPSRTLAAGTTPLGTGLPRNGFVFVPSQPATGPRPFVLLLHGAGSSSSSFNPVLPLLDQLGIVALVVDSRQDTWDTVYGPFGVDVDFIDEALAFVFDRVAIDPNRMGIAGFSDGGSYALSLGLPNGDLFSDVIAWSPGFMQVPSRKGRPAVYVSHGTQDQVLNIDRTSRKLVPRLRDWGYTVNYQEFQGGHSLPQSVLEPSLQALATP